jgi:transposase
MAFPKLTKELAQEAVDTINAHGGNVSAAARTMNVSYGTLQGRMRAAEVMGIKAAPRMSVNATSTLYDAEGNVKLQWIKEGAGERGPDEWAAILKDAFADREPVGKVKLEAGPKNKDLLTVYPIGDHHVAMYSWAEETGADYDIKIAEKLLTSAMSHLVEISPPSETALIIDVGDFFHVDNIKNETARSGHTLDVDTRYAAMIRAGVKMLRTCVERALTKHKQVKVICSPGNHNDIGAVWLSLSLALLYESNPRVHIETKPGKFHYHHFGKVLLGVTHGDTGKPEKLAGVMAADQPELWGKTLHRHWITGHVHNKTQIEFPGVMWETFRTLAARDAWAQASGYRAGRDMCSIVFHAEHGEIARHRFDVCMLE